MSVLHGPEHCWVLQLQAHQARHTSQVGQSSLSANKGGAADGCAHGGGRGAGSGAHGAGAEESGGHCVVWCGVVICGCIRVLFCCNGEKQRRARSAHQSAPRKLQSSTIFPTSSASHKHGGSHRPKHRDTERHRSIPLSHHTTAYNVLAKRSVVRCIDMRMVQEQCHLANVESSVGDLIKQRACIEAYLSILSHSQACRQYEWSDLTT